MQRKPLAITLDGMEFTIPKIGDKHPVYEIVHAASGRSLRVQFNKRREAVAWLCANVPHIKARLVYVFLTTDYS